MIHIEKNDLEVITRYGWIWIKNKNYLESIDNIKGKYLFFSDDKKELLYLAKVILSKYRLAIAKIPSSNIPNKNKGFGYVLCIYDSKNRYCNELKKFDTNSISFRFWKSDADTRAKKYSKQYINNK
jgi:hypothetical protein